MVMCLYKQRNKFVGKNDIEHLASPFRFICIAGYLEYCPEFGDLRSCWQTVQSLTGTTKKESCCDLFWS